MRFLLITEARSGTHMLRGVFNNHPDVVGFCDYRQDLVSVKGGLTQFLSKVYSQVPPGSNIGAFTHFGELRRLSDTEKTGWIDRDWQSLREIHDRIIVLTRKSSLRRFLSIRLATAKGDPNWSCDTPRESAPPLFDFDISRFTKWHHLSKQNTREISKLMEPYLHIVYEDLVSDWMGTMQRVYEYLGLSWDNPQIVPIQQETRPLEDIVKDWDSVLQDASARGINLLGMPYG